MFRKGYIITLLLLIPLLFSCSNSTQNTKTNEENSSTSQIDNTTNAFTQTYENMKNQLNLQLNVEIAKTMDTNESSGSNYAYFFNFDSKTDGVVFARLNPTGFIHYHGTIDTQYHRIDGEKTTIFSHYVNQWVRNDRYTESQITTNELMSESNYISLVVNGSIYDILKDAESIEAIEYDNFDDIEYATYKITNSQYDIFNHPSIKLLFEEIENQYEVNIEDFANEIVYKVYLNEDDQLIRRIQIDFSNLFSKLITDLKNKYEFLNIPKSYIIKYDFNQFNQTNTELPKSFNYFEKTDTQTKQAFLELWNKGNETLNQANSLTVSQDINIQMSTGSYSSTESNINLKMDVLTDPMVIKTTINGGYEFYTTEENDKMFIYRHNGTNYVKTQTVVDESSQTDDFLVPINENYIRIENEYTQDDVDYRLYKYALSYEEFSEYLGAFDNYLSLYQTKSNADLSDVKILITLLFNLDQSSLETIKIDLTEYLKAVYQSASNTNVTSSTLTINFSNINSVTIDSSFKDDAVVDDAVDEIDPSLDYQIIEKGETHTGYFNHSDDIDVYQFEVTQSGKYYFSLNYLDNVIIGIFDENNEQIYDSSTNDFKMDLSQGRYYIYIYNTMTDFTNYEFVLDYVGTDDYSDYVEDEENYFVGELVGHEELSGNIDYPSDYDVFKIPHRSHVKLQFTSEKDIEMLVLAGNNETIVINGEEFSQYFQALNWNNEMEYIYFVVYSPTREKGSYSFTYIYDVDTVARNIDFDEEITSYINHSSDYDFYKITVDEPTKVLIRLGGEVKPEMTIYTPGNYLLSRSEYYINGDYYYSVEMNPGTHRIEIKSNAASGNYDFSLTKITEDDYADNVKDTMYPKADINNPETIQSKIDFLGDKDIYNFNMVDQGIVILKFSGDITVSECFSYCRPLTQTNDEYKMVIDTNLSYTSSRYYLITSQSTIGNYQIEVIDYDDSTDYPDLLESDQIPLVDMNNPIELIYHNTEDLDFIKINVSEEHIYNFRFTIFWRLGLKIYDENKNLIFEQSSDINSTKLSPGQYYLSIDSEGTGLFTLLIEKVVDDVESTLEVDINEPIKGYINYNGDVDIYTFTITEETTMGFDIGVNGSRRNSRFILKDELGIVLYDELLNYFYGDFYSSNYKPGRYTIEVSGDYDYDDYYYIRKN